MVKITLKAARVNAGLTQKQAAMFLKVTNKTLSNWERGMSFPTLKYLDPICELYGVTYDDISFCPPIHLKRI